jgi:hypothetical protein
MQRGPHPGGGLLDPDANARRTAGQRRGGYVSERLTYITPEAAEYRSVIANAAESGITGGQIYDALLAQCAIKAKTEIIYTWNVAHYQRLGSNVANLVRAP